MTPKKNHLAASVNAYDVLPTDLIVELRKHFRGGTLYLPVRPRRPPVDMAEAGRKARKLFADIMSEGSRDQRRKPILYIAAQLGIPVYTVHYLLKRQRVGKDEGGEDCLPE